MRKLLVLLALVLVTLPNLGCCARLRNCFRRGSPCCGTATVAPALLGAPLAVGTPYMPPTAPMAQAVPMQPSYQSCEPCVPCEQGCNDYQGQTGWSAGSYIEGGAEGCSDCEMVPYAGGSMSGESVDPRPTGNE